MVRVSAVHGLSFSRHAMPEFCLSFSSRPSRGRRESRVRKRAHSLACKMEEARKFSHHRYARNIRPSLREWFYGLLRALPGDRALLSPSPARSPRKLDISVEMSGPHDFTVHIVHARLARQCVHRIPRPTFVTIAKRPSLSGTGWRESVMLCLANSEAKYFLRKG